MKTLLYLDAEKAVWIGYKRGAIIMVQEQRIKCGDDAFVPCEWLVSKKQTIQLIVESPLEEITLHPLHIASSRFEQYSNSKALRQQLSEQYPQAIVRTPSAKAMLNAVVLHQISLSPPQLNWLSHARQNKVRLTSALTVSEALADCVNRSEKQVLLVIRIGGVLKHVFCSAGYALFVRAFEFEQPGRFIAEINETIKHLHSLKLSKTNLCVYVDGVSDDEILEIGQLESVLTVEKLIFNVCENHNGTQAKNDKSTVYSLTNTLVSHVISSRSLLNKHKQRHSALLTTDQIPSDSDRNRTGFVVPASLSLCASLLVANTMHQEHDRYLQNQNKTQQIMALSQVVQNHKTQLEDIGEIALPFGQALEHVNRLESAQALNPAIILTIIAGVLSEHKQLTLQDIAWSIVDENMPERVADSVDGGANQVFPSVSNRSQLSTVSHLPSKVVVNVSGLVNDNHALREQQSLVHELASAFEAQPEIGSVDITESPLAQASRLNQLDDSSQSLSFRLSFAVSRSVKDDV